jgi:hypothetical protein
MRKLAVLIIMFMAFLVMPVSVNAGACERYWDGLVGQTFAITVNKVEFTVYFNDSCFGPCPGGIVVLEYTDVQVVDGILYEAEISINLSYSTTSEYVIVEGLLFALSDGQLILLPEDPWIFDIVEEEDTL